MKKRYLLLIALLGTSHLFAQTLFTYGQDKVEKEDFLRAYNKNKSSVTDKEKSLKEYLDLYTKFKLKVKAAEELQLDTLPQLQTDLQNFSTQIQEGYMNDDKGVNDLINEAFARQQKDIHVLHLYVLVNNNTTPADSLKAYNAIQEAYKQINKKGTDYNKLAIDLNAKYGVDIKAADMGYITAFSIPYQYENIVYGLKPGTTAKPYRSKNAWHIFKNVDERTSIGKWKVAQIFISFPPNATEEEKNIAHKKIDSLYSRLKAGDNFTELAKKHSEDKLTYQNGGELPEFGAGRFDPSFENKVFALTKNGDITEPIATNQGYHIVKRIQQTPTATEKTEEITNSLKVKITQDARIQIARNQFLKTVLAKINYKRNNDVTDASIIKAADSVVANKKIIESDIDNNTIFSFENTINTKGKDWLTYVNNYIQNGEVYKGETTKELFDKFIATTAFDYYRKNLATYNADYKYQVQEFKEGNMLFEIMEKNVWNKASGDSVGLATYYQEHKSKYLWPASVTAILFNCSDAHVANQAVKEITNGKNWKTIAEQSNAQIQSDSGRYELSQIILPAGTTATVGLITTPVINPTDSTASFAKILSILPENQQRSFEEAKGLVINDYQAFIEEKWIEELKKKYPVIINEQVFKSLLQ